MEPNTSSSPAAWTFFPAAILEHGEPEPSAREDPSILSLAFSPAPSPGLVPASGSRSGTPWWQQIPPSPAVAARNGSLSVHAQATWSQSPPSSFPTAGTLPMSGYDLFSKPPEATAATPLPPTLLGGHQWEQGELSSSSSSRAASVPPADCPSPPGLLGLAAAWPSNNKEMSLSSFFSLSSAGDLAAPQSSDNLVGLTQPATSDSEKELLPQSLRRIPLLAVEKSPVDAPLPPIQEEQEQEEEEIDVSAFLVSDPEMAGCSGGRGASLSWMAPAGTGNSWPPKLPPAVASTPCTILSTSSGSMRMPCHVSGSSIGFGVASSIGGMMKPSAPVLPLVPPSSQGGGAASSSNFSGFFAQPSSGSILAALVPNLQGPLHLLPVKQEAMEYVDDATPRRHPDVISLVDDDEYGLYQDGDGMLFSVPGPSFAPSSWARGSSSGSPCFAPGSWPGSSPSFAPSTWDWHSSSSRPSFPGSTPCFDRRTSADVYGSGSSSAPEELYIRGIKMPSTFRLPPLPRFSQRAGAGRGRGGDAAEIVFTDAELAIIRKEKNLQELLRTDHKKVKRILYNRAYSAMAKIRKAMQTKELERLVEALELQRTSLCEELQSLEEGSAALRAEKMEMQMTIGELEQQAMLKDAVREVLKAEIQKLNHPKLN